jgi:hypothetical protein
VVNLPLTHSAILLDLGTGQGLEVRLKYYLLIRDPESTSTSWEIAVNESAIACLSYELDTEHVILTQNTIDGVLVLGVQFRRLFPAAQEDSRRTSSGERVDDVSNRLGSAGRGLDGSVLIHNAVGGGRIDGGEASTSSSSLGITASQDVVGELCTIGNLRWVGGVLCGRVLLDALYRLLDSGLIRGDAFFFRRLSSCCIGTKSNKLLDLIVIEADEVLEKNNPLKGDPAATRARG